MQARAGVTELADRIAQNVFTRIPSKTGTFLSEQEFVLWAYLDSKDRPRVKWLEQSADQVGPLLRRSSEETLKLDWPVQSLSLKSGDPYALLAINFEQRSRIRVNGIVQSIRKNDVELRVAQVYSNCSKYIQPRIVEQRDSQGGTAAQIELQKWFAKSDTLFIASGNRSIGLDVSHRGGSAGFSQFSDGLLLIPDYVGNSMFNTLGNLIESKNVGILSMDFSSGAAIELIGKADILWEECPLASFPNTQRALKVTIDKYRYRPDESRLGWRKQ